MILDTATDLLLDVRGLTVEFPSERGWIRVIDDVSFSVGKGETVAVVGESGSGKTVTSLAVVGLTAAQGGRIVAGEVNFGGADLTKLKDRDLRAIRGDRIGMIFQQPFRSLNPAFTVGEQIAEVLRRHKGLNRRDAHKRAIELLDRVHIPGASTRVRDYPHTFSGGMSQRVMIAMALACDPELLIADEPTTALDVTVQATILDLLEEIQRDAGISILLISHDLAVVAQRSDQVVVMYAGQVIEHGTAESTFYRPFHPYAEGLLASIPRPGGRRLSSIPGNVPRPGEPVSGCRFHPRCPYAVPGRCDVEVPALMIDGDRGVRCVRYDEIELKGIESP